MIAMFKSVLLAASAATASAFVAGPALPVRTNAGRKLPLQCVLILLSSAPAKNGFVALGWRRSSVQRGQRRRRRLATGLRKAVARVRMC